MMKKILLICMMLFSLSVSAQVQRIGQSNPQPTDTVPQLSIMFNNTASPSLLLKEAGMYQKRAISTLLIGGAIGGVMLAVDNDTQGADSWHGLGIGIVAASGIISLIYEMMSADRTKKAGEQFERISISLGGISYHF